MIIQDKVSIPHADTEYIITSHNTQNLIILTILLIHGYFTARLHAA